MTEAQQALFEKWKHYAEKVAIRWTLKNNLSFAVSDYKQAALIGLWNACEKFDPSRGIKFQTFALIRICGAMKDESRAVDYKSRYARRFNIGPDVITMSALEKPDNDQSRPPTFEDPRACFTEKLCDADLMKWLLARLPRKSRNIIALYYGPKQLSGKEIAKLYKVTPGRVHQIVHRAILQMRELLDVHVEAKRDLISPRKNYVKLSARRPQSARHVGIASSQSSKIACGNFGTRVAVETRLCAHRPTASIG